MKFVFDVNTLCKQNLILINKENCDIDTNWVKQTFMLGLIDKYLHWKEIFHVFKIHCNKT